MHQMTGDLTRKVIGFPHSNTDRCGKATNPGHGPVNIMAIGSIRQTMDGSGFPATIGMRAV